MSESGEVTDVLIPRQALTASVFDVRRGPMHPKNIVDWARVATSEPNLRGGFISVESHRHEMARQQRADAGV